jgi:hypothetical protein
MFLCLLNEILKKKMSLENADHVLECISLFQMGPTNSTNSNEKETLVQRPF